MRWLAPYVRSERLLRTVVLSGLLVNLHAVRVSSAQDAAIRPCLSDGSSAAVEQLLTQQQSIYETLFSAPYVPCRDLALAIDTDLIAPGDVATGLTQTGESFSLVVRQVPMYIDQWAGTPGVSADLASAMDNARAVLAFVVADFYGLGAVEYTAAIYIAVDTAEGERLRLLLPLMVLPPPAQELLFCPAGTGDPHFEACVANARTDFRVCVNTAYNNFQHCLLSNGLLDAATLGAIGCLTGAQGGAIGAAVGCAAGVLAGVAVAALQCLDGLRNDLLNCNLRFQGDLDNCCHEAVARQAAGDPSTP